MNKWLDKLAQVAVKRQRRVLGLMSGTSLDGLDMALCKISGFGTSTRVSLDHYQSVPFSDRSCSTFRKLAFREDSGIADILTFNRRLSDEWVEIVLQQLGSWGVKPVDVDMIASHGQTALHLPGSPPEETVTLQLVDGDRLALKTGIITVSDFRQTYIAAGFEGAPLAPLAEKLLFQDKKESRILLNVGGISNFTLLESGDNSTEIPLSTDCGPGNTLLDESVRRLLPGHDFDPEGSFARRGEIIGTLLDMLLSDGFFKKPIPKSTGQETFNWSRLHEKILSLGGEPDISDLLATLTEFTAITISDTLREALAMPGTETGRPQSVEGATEPWEVPEQMRGQKRLKRSGRVETPVVYVSGGGINNLYLMERIRLQLSEFQIRNLSDLGVDPDAKEALLFAVLANESIAGEGWRAPGGKRFTLGKISLP